MEKRRQSINHKSPRAHSVIRRETHPSIHPFTHASSFKRTSFRIASCTHPVTSSTLKTPSSASLCCNLYVSSPRDPSLRVSRPPEPLDVAAVRARARTGGCAALLRVVIRSTRRRRTAATRSTFDRGDAVTADDAFADMMISRPFGRSVVRSVVDDCRQRFKRRATRSLLERSVRPSENFGQTVEFGFLWTQFGGL